MVGVGLSKGFDASRCRALTARGRCSRTHHAAPRSRAAISKAFRAPAPQASARYFCGVKSTQNRCADIAPGAAPRFPAMLGASGAKRTRFAQTPFGLSPLAPPLLGGADGGERQEPARAGFEVLRLRVAPGLNRGPATSIETWNAAWCRLADQGGRARSRAGLHLTGTPRDSQGRAAVRPGSAGCRMQSKGISPLASRADASPACHDNRRNKRNQKCSCREYARSAGSLDSRSARGIPNSLQSLRSLRSDMRNPSFRARLQVSAPSRQMEPIADPPFRRPGLDPGPSDVSGFDRSRWIPDRVRDDGKKRVAAGFEGWPLTFPAVSAAEKRRGGWRKTKRCLSAASQTRSEFFSSHPHRASQGTRAAGGDVRASGFGYFCRLKSTSPKACEAGGRNGFDPEQKTLTHAGEKTTQIITGGPR